MISAALRLAGCAAVLLAMLSGPASAWLPEKPVRIIVPFAAGGPSDTVARIIAQEMTRTLKAPVYVDNISGSGGRTGVLTFLEEARDGHTLLMGHMGTHGSAPALIADLAYDPVKDFAPVGLTAGMPIIVTAAARTKVHDLKSLGELMRTRGKDLRLAHAGRGSVSLAGALLLASIFDASPTLVAYAGTGPALNDLLGGKVDVLVDQIVNIAPVAATKKVRALAIASPGRSEALPDVMTTLESGVPMQMEAWNALFAKRGTPPEQIEALNAALRRALNDPGSRARLLDLGADPADDAHGTPDALARLVEEEVARWSATLFQLRN